MFCALVIGLAALPEFARAGMFSQILEACRMLVGVSAAETDRIDVSLHSGHQSLSGKMAVEIDEMTHDAYLYDISFDQSPFQGPTDSRVLVVLGDDSGLRKRSDFAVGYIDAAWNPSGETLLLLDVDGNFEIHSVDEFKKIRTERRIMAGLVPSVMRLRGRRYTGMGSVISHSRISIPQVRWRSDREAEISYSSHHPTLLVTVTDDRLVTTQLIKD